MKYQVMIKMLLLLTSRRKVTAREIAERFEISVRSVYRYVEELNVAGVPIDVVRGRYGGIFIADTFKLPSGFFTREEYAAVENALTAMLSTMSDEDLISALEKLKRQQKADRRELSVCGNIIVDGGAWADLGKFPQKMKVCEQAVKDSLCLEIDYISRDGEHSKRVIDPYVLILKQNVWYVYAFCHTRQDFRTFKIGRIKSATFTGAEFKKKDFTRDDIDLNFNYSDKQLTEVTLEIEKNSLADAEEWLGIDNIEPLGNKFIATITLPDDESLVNKILSYGGTVRVAEPAYLRKKVKQAARRIAEAD